MHAQYQMASVKALVQVDFSVHDYLNPNKILIKKQIVQKWLSSGRCHFVKKYFYGIKPLHANVQCVYIVYAKYQMASVKALVEVDFPVHALYEH